MPELLPDAMVTRGPRPSPAQRLVHWKFLALSSLFFIVVTVVFITVFSIQRINDHKAQQATAASAYVSQLMAIAVNTGEQNLDEMVNAFLGTLAGVKIFNCVHLTIEPMKRSYGWPYQNCQGSQDPEGPVLEVTSQRMNRPGARRGLSSSGPKPKPRRDLHRLLPESCGFTLASALESPSKGLYWAPGEKISSRHGWDLARRLKQRQQNHDHHDDYGDSQQYSQAAADSDKAALQNQPHRPNTDSDQQRY